MELFKKVPVEFISVYDSIEDDATYQLSGKDLKKMMQDAQYEIIDAIPASIYVKDKEGKIVLANRFVLEMFGYKSREEIIGKQNKDLLPNYISQEIDKVDQYVWETEKVHTTEELAKMCAFKEIQTFSTTKRVMAGGNYLLGVSANITTLKNYYQKDWNMNYRCECGKVKNKIREATSIYGISALEDIKTPMQQVYAVNKSAHECTEILEKTIMESRTQLAVAYVRKLQQSQAVIARAVQSVELTIDENTDLMYQLLGMETEKPLAVMRQKDIYERLKKYHSLDVNAGMIKLEEEKNFYFLCHKVSFYRMLGRLIQYCRHRILTAKKGRIFFSFFTEPGFSVLRIQDTAGVNNRPSLEQLYYNLPAKAIHHLKTDLRFCYLEMRRIYGNFHVRFYEEGCRFDLRFPTCVV